MDPDPDVGEAEGSREMSADFWLSVQKRLEAKDGSSVSSHDKNIVSILATNQKTKGWMSLIPIGLLSSYRYLYDCVKGLGCEDADIIERDVLRTVGAVKDGPGVFGDTTDFGKAGKARAMHRVLTAISITDSMGYCQGMNYVVDYLLKLVSEEDAFCLFLFALRNKHLCCLYETKLPVLSDYMEIFERQLSHRAPFLAHHLKERGFIAPFYSIEWFTTLFVLSCPFELTVAIWDLFLMGAKDVQLRCAVALMESIEPLLMMMGTEELLKNFRTVALYKVDASEVISRALRLELVPVKVGCPDLYGQPKPNGVNQESHNYTMASATSDTALSSDCSFVIDPRSKVKDDEGSSSDGPEVYSSTNMQIDILLTLRLRYLRKAREAMQERDVTTGKWAQEQLQRGCELTLQKFEQPSLLSDEPDEPSTDIEADCVPRNSKDKSDSLSDEDDSGSCMSTPVFSARQTEESGVSEESPTEGNSELKESFSVQNYFEFLVDGALMSKAYALKEVIASCDRVTQWVHLNQKWADCLEYMENKLSQYNMADHMLRYAITINAHIRVISFFLAVAGADPNSQDRWLRTPLHFAAAHNRPDVVRVLLLAGADYSIPGALNKAIAIAPVSSPLSGASKSGRMVTPAVLCQATYGTSLASYPAALTILRGKSCVLCNSLESFAAAAKRRHSRIMNGFHIPNMNVQLTLRNSESAADSTNTSQTSTGKVAVLYCPKCNVPMCKACFPDHQCIYDIIQEEITWKVQLTTSKSEEDFDSRERFSNSSFVEDENDGRTKRTGALRQLGQALRMRRPSFFRKNNRSSTIVQDGESDDSDAIDLGRDSISTASGELIPPDDEDEEFLEHNEEDLTQAIAEKEKTSADSEDDFTLPNCDSKSPRSDVHNHNAVRKPSILSISSIFKRDSPSVDEASHSPATPSSKPETVSRGISGGLKKIKEKMKKKSKSEPSEDIEVSMTKGGMPMYWIGYRDEANRQTTLQPWQIILLPLVQGGEYTRVLERSGKLDVCEGLRQENGCATAAHDSSDTAGAKHQGDIVEDSDDVWSDLGCRFDDRVGDDAIHRQVQQIYANSMNVSSKDNTTFARRKEPKYLYFVSEMEGLYRILGRDALDIFAIEPLPPPPPMITSVSDSYLHAQHHNHSQPSQMVCSQAGDSDNPSESTRQAENQDECSEESRALFRRAKSSENEEDEANDSPLPTLKSLAISHEDTLRIETMNRKASFESESIPSQHDSDVDPSAVSPQSTAKGLNGLKKRALKRFLSGCWKLSEDDPMWVPDECAWYCRKCSEQFSLFKRKHHCRRCGNVFCDEDAPRVDASECLHESLQQAYQAVVKEEFGKKKEKVQFRLCMSCKNEIRHCIGLYIELDFLLPRYNFSTWLISLLSKSYNNMCQSAPSVDGNSVASSQNDNQGCKGGSDLKNVRLKRFAVAGHWMDSMADWLWRDRQLQLDHT